MDHPKFSSQQLSASDQGGSFLGFLTQEPAFIGNTARLGTSLVVSLVVQIA